MKRTALVITTVHWPDDTRIRERLIRTLAPRFDVVYAARSPGPSDPSGLTYVELGGGRVMRNLQAMRLALTSDWHVLVVHDPELLVCAMLARVWRRRPVVFDVHEDIPASAHTRSWVPRWARGLIAAAMRVVLKVVERGLVITLAEPGYQRLFSRPHVAFPNYPETSKYPAPAGDPDGPVIYVGDVTPERGADLAVAACSDLGAPLRLIGRVTPATEARLRERSQLGDALSIEGPIPNRVAMEAVGSSSVGLAPLRDLPNYRHSQPTKVLEYLAMGVPVVASDLPGTRSLVGDLDGVLLVEPGDVRALTDAIGLARSPEMAGLARAQAAQVRSRYGWPDEEVRDFYGSLV